MAPHSERVQTADPGTSENEPGRVHAPAQEQAEAEHARENSNPVDVARSPELHRDTGHQGDRGDVDPVERRSAPRRAPRATQQRHHGRNEHE